MTHVGSRQSPQSTAIATAPLLDQPFRHTTREEKFATASVLPTEYVSSLVKNGASPSASTESTDARCSTLQQTAFASNHTPSPQTTHMTNVQQPSPRSVNFIDSSFTRPRRKGQRLYEPRFPLGDYEKLFNNIHSGFDAENPLTFPCTICIQSFPKKGNWKRHEKEAHGPNVVGWTCPFHDTSLLGTPCMFCPELVGNITHFDKHNIHICLANSNVDAVFPDEEVPKGRTGHVCSDMSLTDRTFARKDRLIQHIQIMHADMALPRGFKPPKEWSKRLDDTLFDSEMLWCGFCRQSFDCMSDRMTHVAKHFHKPRTMEGWTPRWAT